MRRPKKKRKEKLLNCLWRGVMDKTRFEGIKLYRQLCIEEVPRPNGTWYIYAKKGKDNKFYCVQM